MADTRIKQIRIKHGIVKRLAKEKVMYEREAEKEAEKIEKMKLDSGKDEYDIRKQQEVLRETQMMIPDCRRRLITAYNDLKNILETENDLAESEDYQSAKELLDQVTATLESSPVS